jgi:hypothetical protein
MRVPGAGPERQAGLDVLARSFKLSREGAEQSAAWGRGLGREAQAAERERTHQEERQRLGLPPEPSREQQRRGLGLADSPLDPQPNVRQCSHEGLGRRFVQK